METKAKIKLGLITVLLGTTFTFIPVGSPFSFLANSANAQESGQPPVAVAAQPPATLPIQQPAVAAPTTATTPAATPAMTTDQAYSVSAQKLHQARKALAVKDVVTAERIATEVRGMNLVYREFDDRPEYIFTLLQQFRQVAELGRTSMNSEYFRRNYAQLSLNQAYEMLRRGEIELAKQLTQEAANQNVVYNQSERDAGYDPQAMFKRIDDAQRIRAMRENVPAVHVPVQQNNALSQAAQSDLNQAISMLRQARNAMSVGQLDRAEQLCRTAMGYKLADSIYPTGSDTPNRLLAEIAAKRQAFAATQTPSASPSTPNGATQAVYHPTQNPTHLERNIQQVATQPQPAAVAMNTPIVDQAIRDRQTVISQISSGIMQQISDAQRVTREQRNPEAGLEILRQAKIRVEQSPIDQVAKETFIRQIDRAIEDTVKFLERYQTQFEQDKRNQAIWEERRRESENFRSKEERLKTLFDECNKLINEQRFDEAVIYAKKAREFAPDETATHMLLTTTQLASNAYRSLAIRDEKAEAFLGAMFDVDSATIVPNFGASPLHLGKDWKSIINRRRGSGDLLQDRRPDTEKEIIHKLEMPVSVNFDRPVPLVEVLKILGGQTGVDINIDYAALRDVDVTSNHLITIQLMKEIRLRSALNVILEPLNLSYVVKNEMLNITSATKAKGELYQKTYYVGDLMGFQTIDRTGNPYDLNSAMDRAMRMQSGLGVTRGVSGGIPLSSNNTKIDSGLLASMGNPNIMGQNFTGGNMMPNGAGVGVNGMGTGFGTPQAGAGGGSQADFGEIMDLIEAVVSPDSWDEGGEMMEYYPSLSLVVRQTEEVHAEIVDLLAQLRKLNDLQIAVEVRYITLSDEFYEKMGIDFDMKFKNDGATDKVQTQLSSGTNSTTNNNNDNSANTLQVTGGRNVTVGMSAPGDISVDLSIPLNQSSYGLVDPMFGGFSADAGLQMGFALLSEIEAYFFMTATQGDTRSNVLQAPKVTIFNGQMGMITDMSMSPFVTSVIPVVGDFAAAYQPVITILSEGQLLSVQGTVSDDRQHVRLTLNPTFNKITKVNTFKYFGSDSLTDETQTAAEGDSAASASNDARGSTRRTAQSNSGVTIQLPTLAMFSVQTTVSVPDGGTILLGGMKRLSEGRTEAGVPILNKIPYIQRLFMNTAIGRTTQSIMMMVTPRIIIQEEEEEYLTGQRTSP
ncbi:MAG: type II and III secretion system protein [Planctomycetaceae bacterium]|nr:type II and III secretion system protein [Planctomycetaceae bacterium]